MDSNDQDFMSEGDSEENFEEMLNRSNVGPVHLNPGEKIEAVVASITKEWVFIDLGGKSEGYIDVSEFTNEVSAVNHP